MERWKPISYVTDLSLKQARQVLDVCPENELSPCVSKRNQLHNKFDTWSSFWLDLSVSVDIGVGMKCVVFFAEVKMLLLQQHCVGTPWFESGDGVTV